MSNETLHDFGAARERIALGDVSTLERDSASPSIPHASLPNSIGFAFLLCFLFLLYSRVLDFFVPFLHLPIILASTALALLLLSGGIGGVFKSPAGKLLVGFSLWLWLAVPTSVWRGGSVQVLTDEWMKSFAAFLIVGGLLATFRQLRALLTALALAFLAASILVLIIGQTWEGRLTLPTGLYSGPNEVAMAMLAGCVFWSWRITKPSTSALGRVVSAACLLPVLYVIPKTASRGGLLAAVVLFPFLLTRRMGRGRILVMLAVLGGVLVGTVLLPKQIKDRFATMIPGASDEVPSDEESARIQEEARGSTEERWYLLKTSVVLTFQHPIFGVGPGQFEVAENERAGSMGLPRGAWHGTHNTYTQISSEAGIPALIMYVACMVWCWRELVRIERRCKSIGGQLATEMLSAAFVLRAFLLVQIVYFAFAHLGYEVFFPTAAGMIFAMSRISKTELPASAEIAPVPGEHQVGEPQLALSRY